MSNEPAKQLKIQLDKQGRPITHTYLTESSDTQRCEVRIKDRVVPILFVPGIMGSNLKYRDVWSGQETPILLSDEKELANAEVDDSWQPPSSALEILSALIFGLFRTKEERRREINPDVAFVDWESNKIRPLPKRMVYTDRKIAMSSPDNDHEGDVAQEKNSAKEPFQEGESLTEAQKIAQEARMRGWGTVYQGSYVPFLVFLEDTLNDIPACNTEEEYKQVIEKNEVWKKLLPLFQSGSKQSIGAKGDENGSLENTEQLARWLQSAADCEFRVYACGYNWLRDNQESGNGYSNDSIEYFEVKSEKGINKKYGFSDLNSRIKKILKECQQTDSKCNEVIVLTHSMGGLVGRAYAKEQGGSSLSGIYHNVMPATGAPAFYKRLKAGFGGENIVTTIASPIFGYSAERVTPVLLNSIGALELMPWIDYKVLSDNTNQWLKVAEKATPKTIKFSFSTEDLMQNSDAWYSLLPKLYHNGQLQYQKAKLNDKKNQWEEFDPRINPGGIVSPVEELQEISDAARFDLIMRSVRKFQEKHMGFYQQGKTNIAYGNDEKYKAWGSISWLCDSSLHDVKEEDLRQAKLLKTENMYTGKITVELPSGQQLSFQLSKAEDNGDGTVPTDSGCAPEGKVDGRIFIENGYDHQGSYGEEKSASRSSALFSILEFTARKG